MEELRSYLPEDLEEVPGCVERAMSLAETPEPVVCALEELLEKKLLQVAVEVYEKWKMEELPLKLRLQVVEVLATYSNFQAATAHVCSLLEAELVDLEEGTQLFDEILAGMIKSFHPLTAQRTDEVLLAMNSAGATPSKETLRLVVEAKSQYAAPGFLIDVGKAVLTISRRFPEVGVTGRTLLAISSAHLRAADLSSAYLWYLASQLCEEPLALQDEHSLRYISELCRALAVGGRILQLRRILKQVKADGGVLPLSTSTLAISGYTCGRSLLSCWLEPPAEVLRRRALWASEPRGATVTCAEQWDWTQQEESRHEMYQWYPYLSPDTKLERAWLQPLRSWDRSALGLRPPTPAVQAARERLGDHTSSHVDLAAALRIDPPGDGPRPLTLTPEPRTWRSFHAEYVKKAYPTSARMQVQSPEQLKELLLAEKGTRQLLGATVQDPGIPPSTIYEWTKAASPEILARLNAMHLASQSLADLKMALMELSGLPEETLDDWKLSKLKLEKALKTAIGYLQGDSTVPLTDEEYRRLVLDMTEEELQEKFEALRIKPQDQLLGRELAERLEQRLLEEQEEDDELDGSAAEELQLALELLELLGSLGLPWSPWDRRALLAATHALGDASLAQELLSKMRSIETPRGELGPVGQKLSEAMAQGGWEEESAEQFLRGERLYVKRDPNHPLGSLLTKYLDPLLGTGLDPAHALEALTKTYTGPLRPFRRKGRAGAVDEVGEQVEWIDKLQVDGSWEEQFRVLTRADVLEAKFRKPIPSELLVRWDGRRGDVAEGLRLLAELELPVPKEQAKARELLNFVADTLHSA